MKSNYSKYNGVESVPEGACNRFIFCGNTVPGGNENAGEMCDNCLSEVRAAGRGHNVEETLEYDDSRLE